MHVCSSRNPRRPFRCRMATQMSHAKVDVYGLNNYLTSECAPNRKHVDQSAEAKVHRMKRRYDESGTIHSVEGVLLVHLHGHPHALLLKTEIAPDRTVFRLPGGKCHRDEDVRACLARKLRKKLFGHLEETEPLPFHIGELLAVWIRPHFEPVMYPYRPVHITREKETRDIYLVHLENKCNMAVPSDYHLVAVPLFELYDNAAKFGAVASGLPHVLSRLHINICD